MLHTSQESPVMKSGGKMKNFADEVILAQSALVFDDAKDLRSTNGMLDLDSRLGNFGVGRFLLRCQLFSFGLLHRLNHDDIFGRVSLVSSILLKYAFVRETNT